MGEVIKMTPTTEHRTEFVIIEGLEDAIIGFGERAGMVGAVAVYDRVRCVEIVMDEMEVDREEAESKMEELISKSWSNSSSPLFVTCASLV